MSAVAGTFPLQRGAFKTFDPFLFCVHQAGAYPPGQDNMGPDPRLLRNRNLGMDFSNEGGWSMYHGETVPGFPVHPHRGFETVSIVAKGLVDHSDSLGCTARYGNGDTQWLTTGRGVQHCEMIPLLQQDRPNPVDLFQIWLNLPRSKKMCPPAFSMLWSETTPVLSVADPDSGLSATVKVVAGPLFGAMPLPPPADSWASDPENEVAIWVVELPRGCRIQLPPAVNGASVTRTLYFVLGHSLSVGSATWQSLTGGRVDASVPVELCAVSAAAKVLVLQGRPIKEPVAQRGSMVMNTQDEVHQAYADYQRTEFGGWPWPKPDHVHPRSKPRHAFHGGKLELPPSSNE